MSAELNTVIKQLMQERGISEDLIKKTIEESLLAAYKRKYGSADNAVVRFGDDDEDLEVTIYSRKKIVDDDDLDDPIREISLEKALEYSNESEIGDELLIEINPKEFDRISIQSAKQKYKQTFREIQKDTLYSEFKEKVGEMIIGYYQRERNGTIYVDLGKTEGILPKKFQSPREVYHPNDRIKALIYEVNKGPVGLQIILSRTHTEFVRKIFELEVPEIYDNTVEIFKIVREPGYRTKIAVYSNRDDVDPVGACVGLKGVRIQAIVRELEGEKVDILKYDPDPQVFIKNALSPAEVMHVILLDETKKQALVVVGENQFSLAIGKQGLNVRLANRMVDWNIDVKTQKQFEEMDIKKDTKKAVEAMFDNISETEGEEEITNIAELPGLPEKVIQTLKQNGVELIEDLVTLDENKLMQLEGINDEDAKLILKIIEENVEIVEEDEDEKGLARQKTGEKNRTNPEPESQIEWDDDVDDTEDDVQAKSQNDAQDNPSEVASEISPEFADDFSSESADNESENDTEDTATEVSGKNKPGDEAAGPEETYECPECGGPITINLTNCPNCGVGLSFEEDEDEDDDE